MPMSIPLANALSPPRGPDCRSYTRLSTPCAISVQSPLMTCSPACRKHRVARRSPTPRAPSGKCQRTGHGHLARRVRTRRHGHRRLVRRRHRGLGRHGRMALSAWSCGHRFRFNVPCMGGAGRFVSLDGGGRFLLRRGLFPGRRFRWHRHSGHVHGLRRQWGSGTDGDASAKQERDRPQNEFPNLECAPSTEVPRVRCA